MGNVGSNAARILYHRGSKIVALSDVSGGIYCKEGLNIDEISDFIAQGKLLKDYNAANILHITNGELLELECDVLIPAALENQITLENAAKIKCKYIVV